MATLQVRLRVLCCVGAGIVECLKGWRCIVGGVEVCGRGGGVWWEGWRSVVGGMEVCGRGKLCGERGGGECRRGGGVWEGVRCVGRNGGVWEGWSVVGGVR